MSAALQTLAKNDARGAATDASILLLFVIPVAASLLGGAAFVKVAFPTCATLLALRLGVCDAGRFLRLLVWTIILAPGLRHFVDWYEGYSQTNSIMLAPYLVVLGAAPAALLHLVNGGRYALQFVLLIGVVVAALGLAWLTGAMQDPLLAAMRWLAPMWIALYIVARSGELPPIRESVQSTLRLAVPIVAVYGIVQFVVLAPWDAAYMRAAPITSIGYPEPFLVRVFATMNSPGSLAAMLASGILLLLPRARGPLWIGIVLGFATLLLTTQRAALGGLLIASLVAVVVGQNRLLQRNIGWMAATLAVACILLLVVPGATKKVLTTADSIGHLEQDDSAQQRWQQYDDFVPLLDGQALGRGLAWSTNHLYSTSDQAIPLDSGLIDILVGLGLPGGLLFLGTLGALTVQGLRICRRGGGGDAAVEFAAVTYGLVQLPFGDQHTAEHGMFLYLALGLLLARAGENEVML